MSIFRRACESGEPRRIEPEESDPAIAAPGSRAAKRDGSTTVTRGSLLSAFRDGFWNGDAMNLEAGAIAVRCGADGRTRILIVGTLRESSEWVFPKGHLESGEASAAAAVRELAEEQGTILVALTVVGTFVVARRAVHSIALRWHEELWEKAAAKL